MKKLISVFSYSLILSFLFFMESADANMMRVGGTPGISYEGFCQNSVGQKFHFKGAVPGHHMYSSRRPLTECFLKKKSTEGTITLSIEPTLDTGADKFEQVRPLVLTVPHGTKEQKFGIQQVEHDSKGRKRDFGSTDTFK